MCLSKIGFYLYNDMKPAWDLVVTAGAYSYQNDPVLTLN